MMPLLHVPSAPSRTGLPRQRVRGFSLIELLVGLAIGLIVVAALLVLFANASSTGQNLARSSTQIENGRYVSELLREDIRLAGFFGEMPDSTGAISYTNPSPCLTTPTGFVNPSVGPPAVPFGLPAPVQGIAPTDATYNGCLSNRKAGTSAIVVRRLAVNTTPIASIVDADNQYYVQYSFCATDPLATLLIFDKTKASFTLKNFACAAANPARAYVSRVYYVADCNVCSPNDGMPTLKRLDLVGNTLVVTPLVEGVEELRFEYGFDTNNNGSPDDDDGAGNLTGTYLSDENSPGTGLKAQWRNVMSIKAHYIVRSVEPVTSAPAEAQSFQLGASAVNYASTRFARRAYSATIRLINPSGARE
jgi:type IV pilus assembly protein PilW